MLSGLQPELGGRLERDGVLAQNGNRRLLARQHHVSGPTEKKGGAEAAAVTKRILEPCCQLVAAPHQARDNGGLEPVAVGAWAPIGKAGENQAMSRQSSWSAMAVMMVSVGAAFRLENGFASLNLGIEASQHIGAHMISADPQNPGRISVGSCRCPDARQSARDRGP